MKTIFEAIQKLGGTKKNPVNKESVQQFDFEASIKKLEDMFGSKLPVAFVELQKEYGGFSFNNSVVVKAIENHPVLDDDQLVSLDFFYGLEFEGENSIYKYIQNYKGRIPQTVLPIGQGELNDLICMDLSEKNYGEIFFWISDVAIGKEKDTFLIASDLEDLFLRAFVDSENNDQSDAPEVNYDDDKFKKMNPKLLEMLKKNQQNQGGK